jgi:spore germination cell wall hydrolase CwlJ-like protein
MRRILISLAIIPTMCYELPREIAGAGRGIINPLTVDELQQAKCLATMIYGEARSESAAGMAAVAWTSVNRAVNKTICNVVLAPKQYSVFNSNAALQLVALSFHLEPKQYNIIDKATWAQSFDIAKMVLQRSIQDPTNGATHYVAPAVMREKNYVYPNWTIKPFDCLIG